MERKRFLKSLIICATAGPVVLRACKKRNAVDDPSGTGTVTNEGSTSGGHVDHDH